jgi:2,3-diketo-5-methylthio-1-phosphopentane phosphatase
LISTVVLSDFDGTITRIDTAEHVLTRFARGDWRVFEKQYERGKITLEECLKKQFSLVTASQEEILDELDRVVTFRPNFEGLVRYCRKNRIPTVIVSAGLDFVINHFLRLNNWEGLVKTYMAKTKFRASGIDFDFPELFDPTSANFKQDLVRHYKTEGKKVVYIGDGSADYAAAGDADYLFAIKDSRLAALCKEHGMYCKTITDFKRVVETICTIVA